MHKLLDRGRDAAAGGRAAGVADRDRPKAIRALIARLGGPGGLAVAYEAGPTGWALKRLLDSLGVACDVIAPSLVPVRPGDRVKTDRRDAKKLVRFFARGELTFVAPPTPEQEGLRDLIRCREDLRDARDRARQRVSRRCCVTGTVHARASTGRSVIATGSRRRRLDDQVAQPALETMRAHLEMTETQLRALDVQLDRIATAERWKAGRGARPASAGSRP